MGRKNIRKVLAEDGHRMSIGDQYVDFACRSLDEFAKKEAALMVQDRWSASSVLDLLFPKSTLDKVRAVTAMVEPRSYVVGYSDLLPHCTLRIDYTACPGTLPIKPEAVDLQLPGFHRLVSTAAEVCGIHRKYGRVKAMLRWFNRNATPGAVRNYWPSVLQLCPGVPAFKDMIETPPDRYATPNGIGAMLPLIRDTAGTVAGMALMSADASPNSDLGVGLFCRARSDSWEGLSIGLNELFFNL